MTESKILVATDAGGQAIYWIRFRGPPERLLLPHGDNRLFDVQILALTETGCAYHQGAGPGRA